MKQAINISDTLLKNASQCVGVDDISEVINMALQELITNHQVTEKRRQPPVSIAGKGKIIGSIIEPSVDIEDFGCLK